jgi:hypothetical protein
LGYLARQAGGISPFLRLECLLSHLVINMQNKSNNNPVEGTTTALLNYFFDTYGKDEFKRALGQFFEGENRLGPSDEIVIKNEMEEDLLMEYLVFDHRLNNGKKLLEDFVAKNPLKLKSKQLEVYETMQFNKYGLFEVKDFKMEEWIDFENMQSGKNYHVIEKIGTKSAFIGQILLCRVGKVLDEWRMIGSNPIAVPITMGKGMKKTLRESKDALSTKDALKFISR